MITESGNGIGKCILAKRRVGFRTEGERSRKRNVIFSGEEERGVRFGEEKTSGSSEGKVSDDGRGIQDEIDDRGG